MKYLELIAYYKAKHKPLYLSLVCLNQMKGGKVEQHATDIIRYIEHRGIEFPLEKYLERVNQLSVLQQDFEKNRRFAIKSYEEIQPIDDELYKLSLLLSFIITNHRFEILETLVDFVKEPPTEHVNVLIIGYGTGYEIKLCADHLKASNIWAFDNSPHSYEYATDLLNFFGHEAKKVKLETFPLEADEGIDPYVDTFDKIIICEVMEHLEKPDKCLENLRKVLKPGGKLFVTMAINIAQEDHIQLYSSPEQARNQILRSGLRIARDLFTPMTILPFEETDRNSISSKGNFIAIVYR
jgi:SAM-dependent methyltransferase